MELTLGRRRCEKVCVWLLLQAQPCSCLLLLLQPLVLLNASLHLYSQQTFCQHGATRGPMGGSLRSDTAFVARSGLPGQERQAAAPVWARTDPGVVSQPPESLLRQGLALHALGARAGEVQQRFHAIGLEKRHPRRRGGHQVPVGACRMPLQGHGSADG